MKKLYFLFAILYIFLLTRCQESGIHPEYLARKITYRDLEQVNSSLHLRNDISVDEGRLVFYSIQDFEATVHHTSVIEIPLPMHLSAASLLEDTTFNKVLVDVPIRLLRVLNRNFEVEIGNEIFKLDFVKQKVAVITKWKLKLKEYRDHFEQMKYLENDVDLYHMNDDVFALKASGYKKSVEQPELTLTGVFCGGGCGVLNGTSGDIEAPRNVPTSERLFYRATTLYQKYGIYFELSSKVINRWPRVPITSDEGRFNFGRQITFDYETNCGRTAVGSHGGFVTTHMTATSGNTGLFEHKQVIYGGIIGLKKFSVTANYHTHEWTSNLYNEYGFSQASHALSCRK